MMTKVVLNLAEFLDINTDPKMDVPCLQESQLF